MLLQWLVCRRIPSEKGAMYSRRWLVPVLCDSVGVEIPSGGIASNCFGGTDLAGMLVPNPHLHRGVLRLSSARPRGPGRGRPDKALSLCTWFTATTVCDRWTWGSHDSLRRQH